MTYVNISVGWFVWSGEASSLAALTDPNRLNAYIDALSNWRFDDYIQFELTEQSHRWIRAELGITTKEIGRLMHQYVNRGGTIDEVVETRPEWHEYDYHHDLRFSIQGTPVYIESRLYHEVPVELDASWILVVNVHQP